VRFQVELESLCFGIGRRLRRFCLFEPYSVPLETLKKDHGHTICIVLVLCFVATQVLIFSRICISVKSLSFELWLMAALRTSFAFNCYLERGVMFACSHSGGVCLQLCL